MAKTDPVPPRDAVCGVVCPAVIPNCGCVAKKCTTKVLCGGGVGYPAPAGDAGAKVAPPQDAAIACPAI
jgi:hypothetical protein